MAEPSYWDDSGTIPVHLSPTNSQADEYSNIAESSQSADSNFNWSYATDQEQVLFLMSYDVTEEISTSEAYFPYNPQQDPNAPTQASWIQLYRAINDASGTIKFPSHQCITPAYLVRRTDSSGQRSFILINTDKVYERRWYTVYTMPLSDNLAECLNRNRVSYEFDGTSGQRHKGSINSRADTITFESESNAKGGQHSEHRVDSQAHRFIDKFTFVSSGPADEVSIVDGGYWTRPDNGWKAGDEVLKGELTIDYKRPKKNTDT
jgi:hypothetical protein